MSETAPDHALPVQAQPTPARRGPSGLFLVTVYTLICVGIFLLQAFPLTGIFLMLFAAALWIGIIVHIAMIHIFVASLWGSIGRAWVLLPIAFYAGALVLHFAAVWDVKGQTRAIEAANAAVVPIKDDQPFTFSYAPNDYGGRTLLERYRTDQMVTPLGGNSRDGAAEMISYGRGAACESAQQFPSYDKRFEPSLINRDLFPDYKKPDKTRQCLIFRKGPLEDVRYRIKAESINAKGPLVDRYGTKWTVYDAKTGVLLVTVQSAEFSVVKLIPMVLAGCALNSGAPSWDCAAGLAKTFGYSGAGYRPENNRYIYPSRDPETWATRPLAHALSLEPRQPTD
jgi:hypothetical protein